MNTAVDHSQSPNTEPDSLVSGMTGPVAGAQRAGNDERPKPVRRSGLNSELADRWLMWQIKMIADVITGCVYTPEGKPLAIRPRNPTGVEQLDRAASEVAQTGDPALFTEIPFGQVSGRLGDVIATPVKEGDQTLAIVALLMTPRPQSRQNVVMQLLQWGGYWLHSLSQLSDGVEQDAGTFTHSIVTTILHHDNTHKSCMEIASRLAIRLDCDRVTVGLRHGVVVRTECISHLASFDPRTQLVRRFEAAMEESLDQEHTITVPALESGTNAIDQAHRDLSTHNNDCAAMTVPLTGRNGSFGAIVFERDAKQPFDSDTQQWCESVLSAVAPALELKRFDERPLRSKVLDSARKSLAELVGPSHLKLKIAVGCVAALLVMGSIFDGNYRVSAPATIEGATSQVIASPIAGFIKSSHVRAGDTVEEGQILARLDDRPLQLELKKWLGEENKVKKAYQEALAKRARTELSILRAKADQINAELSLVRERIQRTELKAPYAGFVTSGDLSQSLGSPVDIGEVLFEVAPLQEYRAAIEVDERDMAGVANDRQGQMVIAALPGEPHPFTVTQVLPVAISGEGNSYFRVEATFNDDTTDLRPGMEGVARIEMGDRKLLWIWTHKLIDSVRLWLWTNGW
ncbi:MAG: efflux RND transporter periplasmic adaptor subunit [Pseudomonadota bacterium]